MLADLSTIRRASDARDGALGIGNQVSIMTLQTDRYTNYMERVLNCLVWQCNTLSCNEPINV